MFLPAEIPWEEEWWLVAVETKTGAKTIPAHNHQFDLWLANIDVYQKPSARKFLGEQICAKYLDSVFSDNYTALNLYHSVLILQ